MSRPLKTTAAVLFCLTAMAYGHMPFEITSVARLQHDRLEIVVTFSNIGATALLADQNLQAIDSAAYEKLRPLLLETAWQLYKVSVDDRPLSAERAGVRLKPNGEVEFVLIYPNPGNARLRLDPAYLSKLPSEFTGSLAVFDAAEKQLGAKILTRGATPLEIALGAPTRPETIPAGQEPRPASTPGFREFLKLGIKHILTGYDHLLFLCGLLVACRNVRSMLVVITCFTVAHSFTLALAALNVVNISSRIVEPLIALSIIFIGVENLLFGEAGKGRAWVAFGFGFIHGFGFASALRETGLGTSGPALIVPLFSFNLGVEIGQIAVASVFVPLLWQLRKIPVIARWGTPAVSAVVVILGSYWLLQRTLLS